MIVHNPNIIFIHLPKTGGSTLSAILKHNDDTDDRDTTFDNHDTLKMYVDAGIDISNYHIVTIARNPWDRIVSFYCHHWTIHNRPGKFIFPIMWPEMFGKGHTVYVSFPDYYRNVSSGYRYMEDYMDWVSIDGEVVSDLTVIDFENYEEDVQKFCDKFGIDPRSNSRSFPHRRLNRKMPQEFRDYFRADPEFNEMILREYAREIDHFDYKAPSYTG